MAEVARRGDEYQCPQCGVWRKGIAQHWTKSSTCEYPALSTQIREIFTGLCLTRGSIEHKDHGTNPTFRVTSVNREFLEWCCRELGFWCAAVSEVSFDEQQRRVSIRESFGKEVGELSSQWRLTSRAHPFLAELDGVDPRDLQLTETIARMLFACVGHVVDRSAVTFSTKNGPELSRMFANNGYEVSLYESTGKIALSAASSREFMDLIGSEPVPGVEHKWQELRDLGTWQGQEPTRRVD